MTKIDDGGPAFPVSEDTAHFPGMSLRDWHASQASEADVQHWLGIYLENGMSKTREECKYAYADAMLAAARKAGGA